MKHRTIKLMLAVVVIFTTTALMAQSDEAGCKDHEFFTRLPKYYIQECSENYNEYSFVTGNTTTETVEGSLTKILYTYDGPFGPNLPSRLQVIKNYENAILKMGGKKVYAKTADDGGWTGGTFHLQKDGKEYWLGIYELINDPVDQFSFILLTKEGMKQEIEANAMFEQINAGEAITLYINFETGKSAIQPASQNIVDELYKMLKENPSLNIKIDGHTDNVGNSASNKVLSEKRSESVKAALMNKGIEASRIKSAGYGQEKPIADNTTEDGKARNRRVEIRKL